MHLNRRVEAIESFSYLTFAPPYLVPCDLRHDALKAPDSVERAVKAALTSIAVDALESYGEVAGRSDLRARLAGLLGYDSPEVVVTNGASEAFFLALAVGMEAGTRVGIPRPGFPAYEQLVGALGGCVVPYSVGGTPPSPPDPILPEDVQVLVVAEPHNPTGVMLSVNQRRRILARCSKDGAFLIMDVAHAELPDVAAVLSRHVDTSSLCTVGTMSKYFRLPDLRVGFAASRHTGLIAGMIRLKTHLSMGVSGVQQAVALRVLQDALGAPDMQLRHETLRQYASLLVMAVEASRSLDCCALPDGGAHVTVTSQGMSEKDIVAKLLSVGIAGIPGRAFNSPYPCVRLCFAQEDSVVRDAANRLRTL